MTARSGVLCVGSIIVDVGKVIDAYPAVEHLAVIETVSLSTGGPGLNMAVDLRMLGAPFPVAMLGAVGDDDHGAFVLDECARVGIDASGVHRLDGAVTSFSDAMVERDGGRRTFFHHPGVNGLFDATTVDLSRSRARILHAGAPGIHPFMDTSAGDGANGWTALLSRARSAGLHTNLELVDLPPARQAEVALPCLPYLDSIVINELEASSLTGLEVAAGGVDDPADWDGMSALALRLIELGVAKLAVVHCPAGSVAAAPRRRVWRQGSVLLPASDVRSTTGAGDAFAAGVVYGMHEEWTVERCLRLGTAAAAVAVCSPHNSAGILAADACLTVADESGYRPTSS